MKKSLRGKAASVSLAVLTGTALAGFLTTITGCVQEPPPFDPRAAQAWERGSDWQDKSQPMYPLPTTQQSSYIPGITEVRPMQVGMQNVPVGKPVKMTLQEIVHRAVINSLDIRVASYDTAVDQTRVIEALANFDPAFFMNYNYEQVNKGSGGIITSFDPVFNTATKVALYNQADTSTFQTGITQKGIAGGEFTAQYQVQSFWTSPQQTSLNPWYENELSLSVTQPLLQNFGVEVNEARVTISRNNQRVSLLDWRKTVEDTLLQIEKTYWQLVQANEDVKTLEWLVGASEDETKTLFNRQGGDVTAVQIQIANAATESRKALLNSARAHVSDLSDQLKRLMDDPAYPVASATLIVPGDSASDVAMHFDVDSAIETGLENRLELGQQQVRISSAETARAVAKNNLLPSLNFKGSVTSAGQGGDLGSAFNEQGDFGHIGFAAGLQFQMPLGNRAAEAIWQRALLQWQQANDSYLQLTEQVTLDVLVAARQVDTSWQNLAYQRNSRFANEKALQGLQTQQDNAIQLTPEFVQLKLDTQEKLAQAQEAEHGALNDYNFAIANLEKAKGTLLRYNNVLMEEKELPFDLSIKPHPMQNSHTGYSKPEAPNMVGAPAK